MAKGSDFTTADECPKCGALSYQGGYCFGCGTYRPSKRADALEREDLNASEFMETSFGPRVGDVVETEEELDERLSEKALRRQFGKSKAPRWKPSIQVIEEGVSTTALLVQAIVEPYGSTDEGNFSASSVLTLARDRRATSQRLVSSVSNFCAGVGGNDRGGF